MGDQCEGLKEDVCGANKACSWCTSAAVAAACRSQENAKKLPPAVFKCSNIDWEEKKIEKPAIKIPIPFQLQDSCSDTTEDACNAEDGCSWCTSAAVAAACRTLDQAKSLPAAVFHCSKLEEEASIEPASVNPNEGHVEGPGFEISWGFSSSSSNENGDDGVCDGLGDRKSVV